MNLYQTISGEKMPLTMEQVNSMDFQRFTETFSAVIEQTPLSAATVWSYRPFDSLASLHKAFTDFIQRDIIPEVRRGIIRCYPDLAGNLAQSNQLSQESTREHKSAGLLELTEAERKELGSLNESYKKKFEFPFIVCARENKKETILTGLKARLGNSVADEEQRALEEIGKIAWYRLKDIVISEVDHHKL